MAMKIKTSGRGVPGTFQLRGEFQSQVMEGKNGRLLSQRIGRYTKNHWEKTANRHWGHLTKTLASLFKSPNQPDITSSRQRKVEFRSVGGRKAVVKTERWGKLSARYARRKPKSRTFWRKTGKLAEIMTRRLSGRNPAQVRNHRVSRRGKELVIVRASIVYPRLPPPLNSIITGPFLSGSSTETPMAEKPSKGKSRTSVWRLWFPENQRPFVRLVAARLGREHRVQLNKLGRE